jgi:hypothetical protein
MMAHPKNKIIEVVIHNDQDTAGSWKWGRGLLCSLGEMELGLLMHIKMEPICFEERTRDKF